MSDDSIQREAGLRRKIETNWLPHIIQTARMYALPSQKKLEPPHVGSYEDCYAHICWTIFLKVSRSQGF
jgi:hypothetical protein